MQNVRLDDSPAGIKIAGRNINNFRYEDKTTLMTESGEGNGTPLQYSCLENPMEGGAWWATVYGVTKSRTHKQSVEGSTQGGLMMKGFAIKTTSGGAIGWGMMSKSC